MRGNHGIRISFLSAEHYVLISKRVPSKQNHNVRVLILSAGQNKQFILVSGRAPQKMEIIMFDFGLRPRGKPEHFFLV